MSVPLTINGITYNYPVQFDTNWGPTLTAWSTAVTNALAPFSGGNLRALTLTSLTGAPSATGFIRLPNASAGIGFRNFLNNGDLILTVDASNQLTFNGMPIGPLAVLTNGHIFVGNVSNQPADVVMSGDTTITNTGVVTISSGAITDAKVNASAAIAVSKLAALTSSRAVATDGSGFLTPSATTATELGYVNGVTSSIQTQLDSKTTGSLTNTHIFVGNVSNVATDVPLSGDATLANTGAMTLATVNGNVGSFTAANITVNAKGLITAASSGGATAPTRQQFTTGSGTYTRPTNPTPLYLKVTMIGGGGGGSGSGNGSPGTGGTGGATTFSSATANGGIGGAYTYPSIIGGAGGTVSIGLINGLALVGAGGGGSSTNVSGSIPAGGAGGGTPFSGSVLNGAGDTNGASAIANTGCGGQGAGSISSNTEANGTGGGAGGYISGFITSPASSYSYAVGAGGTAGAAGTSGHTGGVGGSGIIIVEEYYQ